MTGPPPPAGYSSADDKTWALVAHFGGAAGALFGGLFGWVAPLVTLLTRGSHSATVRAHALAALNFQALWSIICFVGLVLANCLYSLVLPRLFYLLPLVPIILGVVAGLRANDGIHYRYPLTAAWFT
jgi:uncharacterized Tic20 family protein